MFKHRSSQVIVMALIFIMTATIPLVQARSGGESIGLGSGSRAFDNDPDNGEPWGATRFANNEVISGSLLVNQSDDVVDWYVINVPKGTVVNASLFHVDYNPLDSGEYNLQLLMARFMGPELEILDQSWTQYQWDAVSTLSPIAQDIFLIVLINMTYDNQPSTLPTNYTLSVSYASPSIMAWDNALWGYLEVGNNSNPDAWLKIWPSPLADELFYALIKCPVTGDFDLYAYMVWPHDDERLLTMNISRQRDPLDQKYVFLGGSEGTFYIKIDGVSGYGSFGVVARYYNLTVDDDNIRSLAREIDDNEPVVSTLDQGRDRFDWYKVYLEDGEGISRMDFRIVEGNWDVYNLSFYDSNGVYVVGLYNTLDGGMPSDENPTTPTIALYDLDAGAGGYYYAVVHAVDRWRWDPGMPFEPARCKYSLRFTLPNMPPERIGNIPDVILDEDTVDSSLVLNKYFMDPDLDVLTYSLGRTPTNMDVDVDPKDGKVTITPDMDWFGNEELFFRAVDDGPGMKFVEASVMVKVLPMNDPPSLIRGMELSNLTLNESEVAFTEALGTIFTDPDNDPANPLTFTINLVNDDLTPPTAVLPNPVYNITADALEIGPIDFMFGTATYKITAHDNNGSLPEELPSVTLNVTVVHKNHAPGSKLTAKGPIYISLIEGERNDTLQVYDLVEDNDTRYSGDNLTFSFSGQVNIDARVDTDGLLIFDTSGSEYFPGQNYQEYITLTAQDSQGEFVDIPFKVTVTPIDDPPVFRSTVPSDMTVTVDEGKRREFKVIVDDDDTPTLGLNFSWYIGNVKQSHVNGSFFTFATDFTSADGGARILKVVVSDGTTEISHSWNIEVNDINRAPVSVMISNPVNASVHKKGKAVDFVASANDPDGDELTYIWYDGDTEIGRGATFSTKGFDAGFHTVKVEVSDGTNSINTTVIFEVQKKKGGTSGTPGFDTVLMLAAITVGVTLKLALAYRGKRWEP